MNVSKLPAVRLTAEGDCVIEDAVALDPGSSSKFSVSYVGTDGRQNPLFSPSRPEYGALNTSDNDEQAEGSDGDSTDDGNTTQPPTQPASPTWSRRSGQQQQQHQARTSPVQERPPAYMSRTLSMPLPSQLSQLQNPHRPSPASRLQSTPLIPSVLNQSRQVRDVSVELADSIQLVIQTLLQISPPQVLDPAKEQFSACSLSVPTSSMSALFTAMKNINYISANMQSFCEPNPDIEGAPPVEKTSRQQNEFDIGEMLQCVGDALSGVAAHAGVDLVIYHGDVGLKHVYVSGDESGISFLLSHIVRQILETAERGDTIELGLLVSPISNPAQSGMAMETPPVDDLMTAGPLESTGPVRITIRVSHKYAPSDTHQGVDHPKDVVTTEIRPKPAFSTFLTHRILQDIGGTLKTDLPPPDFFTSGRTCDLEMILERVPVPLPATPYEPEGATTDPTLEQLASFGETLKGKGVTLYASAKGSFAHHLTSYLTAWGMDVTHVSPDGQIDGLGDTEDARMSSYNQLMGTYADGTGPESSKADRQGPAERPSFVFIDDNVEILKERLQALRFEGQAYSVYGGKKRPSLATVGRMRSSSNTSRFGFLNPSKPANNVVIVHFTSLSQYKIVKDVMQSVATSYAATGTPLPEVMVVPKPAGPRRFLTALHTAVTKPTVDPIFTPIATSPMSPGIHRAGSFFGPSSIHEYPGSSPGSATSGSSSQMQSPSGKPNTRPSSNRTNSDRSTRSKEGGPFNPTQIPPSPLALPDNVEYFSSAAQKLGGSPSSGLVIQSPDGQTAGIYFHPRNRNSGRNVSTQNMERDRGQLAVPGPSTRYPTTRMASGGKKDDISFSALHEAATQAAAVRLAGVTSPLSPGILSPGLSATSPVRTVSPEANDGDASMAPPAVSRRPSDEVTKMPSPSADIQVNAPPRRNTKRTDSKDVGAVSAAKKKASVLSDANIVPPISVLIVDDNPINQTILSTFMKRKKIKYESASNGQEAVEKWKTGGFHLILMDIQMPVMDGISATKEIRRLEKQNAAAGYPPMSPASEGMRTPSGSAAETRPLNSPYRSSVIIVALTASSLQSDRVAALAAGCNDFLTKPVSLLWLNNKIIEWGSIKALQMWADIRPEAVSTIQSGQAAKARNVAERLHVPPKRGSSAEKPPPVIRRSSSALEDNAAALALASSAGHVPMIPPSPTGSAFMIPAPSQSTERDASSLMDVSPTRTTPSLPLPAAAVKRRRSEDETEDDDTPKPGSPPKAPVRYARSISRKSRSVTPMQQQHHRHTVHHIAVAVAAEEEPASFDGRANGMVAATFERPEPHLNTPQSDGTMSPPGALPPDETSSDSSSSATASGSASADANAVAMDETWP